MGNGSCRSNTKDRLHASPLLDVAAVLEKKNNSFVLRVKLHSLSLDGAVSSVQWLSRVQLPATLRTTACQASLSITNSGSLLKLMSIESVMPSNHLILCRPLLLLPSIFPSIRSFQMSQLFAWGGLEYWSFSFSISPSNEHSGLISFRIDWMVQSRPHSLFMSIL